MGLIDRIIYAVLFFALGWAAAVARERRADPRGRRKAEPKGEKAERKPRVKKAKPEPTPPGEPLPMD